MKIEVDTIIDKAVLRIYERGDKLSPESMLREIQRANVFVNGNDVKIKFRNDA